MTIPLLAPHAQIAWRDPHTLAIEDPASPDARLLVGNATPNVVRWLRSCDGTHTTTDVLDAAAHQGIPADVASALLTELGRLGLLAAAAPPRDFARGRSPHIGSPLRHDLEALALTGLDAAAVLDQRQQHRVIIEGADRVAHGLVELLAAGHVGAIDTPLRHASRRQVTLRDVGPFGPQAADVGSTPGHAMRRHADRLTTLDDRLARKRVAILCEPQLDPADELPYRIAGIPYLRVITTSRFATIGPLTLPGHTACGACLSLHRSDADPTWPAVLAQFDHHRGGSAPIDSVFAIAIASEVASRLLRVIDTADPSSLVNCTWHFDRTRPAPVRRRWEPHPDCSCQSAPQAA